MGRLNLYCLIRCVLLLACQQRSTGGLPGMEPHYWPQITTRFSPDSHPDFVHFEVFVVESYFQKVAIQPQRMHSFGLP